MQALTGEKSVFGRTPKVANRTVPDFLFVISPYLLTGLAGWTLWQDWTYHRWINFGYAVLNTALALYAIVAFIGSATRSPTSSPTARPGCRSR